MNPNCTLCGCHLTQDNRFPRRLCVCRACAKPRIRVQCQKCGVSVSRANPRRVHCPKCRKEVSIQRQKIGYAVTAWLKAWGFPLPPKRKTVAIEKHGHEMIGKRLCMECMKIKPVSHYRRQEYTCRACLETEHGAIPPRAATLAAAEGMG